MNTLSDQSLGKLKMLSRKLAREKEYWTTKLNGLTYTALPEDFNLDGPSGFDSLEVEIPSSVMARLDKLSKQDDKTLHAVLMFGVAIMLSRLTKKDDLCLGTVTYSEKDNMADLKNVLPVRISVTEDTPVKDLLKSFLSSYQEDILHQRYPFDVLLEDLGSIAGKNTLFDVFVMLNSVQDYNLGSMQSYANLILCFDPAESAMRLKITYNKGLYSQSSIREVSTGITEVLGKLPESMGSPLKALTVDVETDKQYWAKELDGFKYYSFLKPDNNKTVKKVVELTHAFDRSFSNKLVSWCTKNNVTIEDAGLAAYLFSLYMFSYDGDLLVGRVNENSNTVPLRYQFDKILSPEDLVKAIGTKIVNQKKHEHLSIGEIASLIGHGDIDSNPFFDTKFYFNNDPDKTNVTCDCCMMLQGEQLSVSWIFSSKIVDEGYVKNTLGYFCRVLEAFVDRPDELLHKEAILGDLEAKKMTRMFNDTAVAYNNDTTIIQLFEQQVGKSPDAVAVRIGAKSLTYDQLNRKANQVGRTILGFTGGRQEIIPIVCERSLEMFIGIYGILKAGCAYLPIPRDYPQDRIEYMIGESQSSVRLVMAKDRHLYAADIPVIVIDQELDTDIDDGNLSEVVYHPNTLAYVIFTSGSTGKPKGVMIENHSLINRLTWMQKCHPIVAGDVILHKTSMAFDVSVWEIFWWSLQGATVELLPPGHEKDPLLIASVIRDRNVTVLHFVPSMLRAFLNSMSRHEDNSALASLRAVFASGEELTRDIVVSFNEIFLHKPARLINLYGPTEASIDVTVFECPRQDEPEIIPIGRPIDNTRMYILDRNFELQPVGAIGELYIAGQGLARGYVRKPELTSERFFIHPNNEGERIYKTGDLARWQAVGNIEFLGRVDNQIKIRGYRIELSEIEHELMKQPSIKSAVVLCRNENGNKYLCAYYVSDAEIDSNVLEDALGGTLPAYMIPSRFMWLEQMPLNGNGKIDRKQLPEPVQSETTQHHTPRTHVEEIIVQILKDTLGVKSVSVKDSVFRIGLDSMSAIQMVTLINEQLSLDIQLDIFWEFPVVEDLAAKIESEIEIKAKEAEGKNVRVEQERNTLEFLDRYQETVLDHLRDKVNFGKVENIYPMTEIEKAMTYYTVAFPEAPLYLEQAVYTEYLPDLDIDKFKNVIGLLIDKHPTFRSGFDLSSGSHIIYKSYKPPFHYHDLSDLAPNEQSERIEKIRSESRAKPIDFINPTLQFFMFQTGKHNYVTVLQFHHAVIDGWSLQAFMGELYDTYVKVNADENYKPELLKCTYKDQVFSELLEKLNEGLKPYWFNELRDYKRVEFPRPQQAIKSLTSVDTNVIRSGDFISRLQSVCNHHDVTLKEAGFAAYAYALNSLSMNDDIVAGHVTNTRPVMEDGDKLLGCFLNTVPVRIRIDREQSAIALVKSVNQKLVDQKPYERISLLEIKRLAEEPSSDRNPFFDTKYNFIDFTRIRGGNVEEQSADEVRIINYLEENTLCDFCIDMTGGDNMLISWVYSPDKICADVAEQLLADALYFLDCLSESPTEKVNPSNCEKISSQRDVMSVQLEEIEKQIRAIEHVKDVAVISRKEKGNEYIYAYYVGDRLIEAEPSSTLRFVWLAEMPDKAALLELGKRSHQTYIAPRNVVERSLIEIISGITNIPSDTIGIESTITGLGIDSLGMISLQLEISRKFGTRLSIVQLFSFARVIDLAGYIISVTKRD